jgi:hypothetical protein
LPLVVHVAAGLAVPAVLQSDDPVVVRFARLIHRRVRAFWPAFGGSLSLTWLLLSVVQYSHPVLPCGGVGRNVAMLPCVTAVVARPGSSGQEAS